jgi:Ca-activated chloride channel family protein
VRLTLLLLAACGTNRAPEAGVPPNKPTVAEAETPPAAPTETAPVTAASRGPDAPALQKQVVSPAEQRAAATPRPTAGDEALSQDQGILAVMSAGTGGLVEPTVMGGLAMRDGGLGGGGTAEGLGGLGTKGRGAGGAFGSGASRSSGVSGGTRYGARASGGSATGYGAGGGHFSSGGAAARTDPPPPVPARPATRSPSYDWGGVTWLSNDDSMSLASAQRVLWAVKNHAPIDRNALRPHELLNYFSFPAPTPTAGQTFAVGADAERTGPDTLSLALTIRAATPPRPPLDLTLVVDRSGSMSAGGKMEYLQRGLVQLAEHLRAGDHVDVVSFDDRVESPLVDLDVGAAGTARLVETIRALTPRGSTDLDAGLREGYRLARRHGAAGHERRVILVTDALLNQGTVDPDLVSDVGAAMDRDGIHLSAVGVGSDVKDDVLESLTEKGRGAYVFLGSEAVVDRVFGPMFAGLTQNAAEDVHYALDLPPSLAVARFYGEEASTVASDIQPVRVGAGTTQLFLEDLKIRDGEVKPGEPVVLTMTWNDPTTGEARQDRRTFTVGQLLDADPAAVRKARALMAWTDVVRDRGACGDAWSTWETRAARVPDDAEIRYVASLVSGMCTSAPVARRGTPLKIKVDADEVIAEVQLRCGDDPRTDTLSASDTVARFEDPPTGSCDVVLVGSRPMRARLEVTAARGDARCTVRSGAASCG